MPKYHRAMNASIGNHGAGSARDRERQSKAEGPPILCAVERCWFSVGGGKLMSVHVSRRPSPVG